MALETATYISQLEPSNPAPTDQLRQADDHLRLIKQALKNTFPNITGPVTLTQGALNSPTTIPLGIITLWYGAAVDCPAGWAVCNGAVVPRSDGSGTITTPDMRGRVMMGADGSYAPGATLGATTATATSSSSGSHTHTVDGGSHTHSGTVSGTALTIDQMPSHSHGNGIKDDNAGGIFAYGTKAAPGSPGNLQHDSGGAASQGITETVGGGATHTHELTVGSSTHSHAVSTAEAHTHSVTVSTYQPTLAIHYIMKI